MTPLKPDSFWLHILSWLLALAMVAAIIAGAFVTLAALRPDPQMLQFDATDITGVSWGRNFHLTGDDGESHELADFRGKVVALYFGYTRCPDVCPTTMATLGQAVRLLGKDGARVQGLFVTVDPRHDTRGALRKYVRAFDEDFLGLYGDAAATSRTTDEFKVAAGEHHSIPVFLFDASGRLRLVVSPQATADSIVHDVRLLLTQSS
ncbi:MAG TPA: SCO family protein [Burkholderiales bacterium]|nr:SCO family protein [Burkholderiales bacterium]